MLAENNPYPSVLLVEQGSAPATPSSGQARLYRKSDNKLYVKDDAGVETEVGAAAYTDEQAQDAIAALIAAGTHTGISFTYNDAGNLLSATVSGGAGSTVGSTLYLFNTYS